MSDRNTSFPIFLNDVWKLLGFKGVTRLQVAMAHYIQTGNNRRFLAAFRGASKSYLSCAYVVWRLMKDPDLEILIISATESRAKGFVTFCRQIIDTAPFLHQLIPGRGQRDSNLEFEVAGKKPSPNPSLRAFGIGGQITGGRSDLIVGDDIEIPRNSNTAALREKLKNAVMEFEALGKPGSEQLFLGTYESVESIYMDLPEKGFETTVFPVFFTDGMDENGKDVYQGQLNSYITSELKKNPDLMGEPLEYERFTMEDLLAKKLSMGEQGWSLQFLLDPSLSDADKTPLKLRNLIVSDVDPSNLPSNIVWTNKRTSQLEYDHFGFRSDALYEGDVPAMTPYGQAEVSYMYIDPSGLGKDETGYAIGHGYGGRVFVSDVGGYLEGFSESTITGIVKLAILRGGDRIFVEKNFGGGMFNRLLEACIQEHESHIGVDNINSSGRKEERILDILEPAMNLHRVVLCRSVLEKERREHLEKNTSPAYLLTLQMCRLQRIKGCLEHDDRIDALAGLVGQMTAIMGLSPATEAHRKENEAWEKEIQAFASRMSLIQEGPSGWMNSGVRAAWKSRGSLKPK